MTRDEALRAAIAVASRGGTVGMSPDFMAASARLAQAWIAISDRLVESTRWPGPTSEEDIKRCGHGIIAWRSGDGRWVHPVDMLPCHTPPGGDA